MRVLRDTAIMIAVSESKAKTKPRDRAHKGPAMKSGAETGVAAPGKEFPRPWGEIPEMFTGVDARARRGSARDWSEGWYAACFDHGEMFLPRSRPREVFAAFALMNLAIEVGVLSGPGSAHAGQSEPQRSGAAPGRPDERDAPGKVLSMHLADALAYARVHQPVLGRARARVAAAAFETRVSRAEWLPSAGATLQAFEGTTNNSTASYVSVSHVDIPRIGGTSAAAVGGWGPSTSTMAAVAAAQEVFDFGRIAAEAAVADAAYETERHRADSERLGVELLVKEAYYGVQGARAIQRAAEDAYQRSSVHRQMAAAEVKSGLFAPIEVTRADAELARFEVERIRASGAVLTAQSTFAAAVGVPNFLLDAAGAPPELAPPPSLEAGLAQALQRDPELLVARSRVREGESVTRAIGAQMRPDLALTATLSARAGTATPSGAAAGDGTGPLPTVPNWDVGLVLRLPLYDGVLRARRDAASTRAEVARTDVMVLSRQQTAEVQQGYVSFEISEATLGSLRHVVEAGLANYAQAEARFKAGLGTSLELADAETVRTDAEIQLAVGQFNARRARAILTRLIAEEPRDRGDGAGDR
jgi:outer membrane protein